MVLPLSRGRSIDFHEGQRLLGWYLTNPLIDQADKSWMETELKIHTDAVAKFYGNFIKNAKEDSPTAIED